MVPLVSHDTFRWPVGLLVLSIKTRGIRPNLGYYVAFRSHNFVRKCF